MAIRASGRLGPRNTPKAILADKGWAEISQNKIADHVGCSAALVSQVRASIKELIDRPETQTITRNGGSYEMKTANIGRTPATEKETETPIGDADADTDTGEVSGTVTAVKPGKAKVKPRTEKIDPDTTAIMEACKRIETELDAIEAKRPKQTMQTTVLGSLRDVLKRVGKLIETVEGGSR